MLDRLLFFPIAAALGFGAWYFGFGYVGFGILAGIVILIFGALRGESFAPAFETGVVLAVVGLACYWGGFYFARKYGMSLEELDASRNFPKYLRRLPYYGITAITMGVVLIILDIANRRDGK